MGQNLSTERLQTESGADGAFENFQSLFEENNYDPSSGRKSLGFRAPLYFSEIVRNFCVQQQQNVRLAVKLSIFKTSRRHLELEK